jgi:hypothetical protein
LSDYARIDFEDFAELLETGDLRETPVDLDTFIYDPYYLGGAKIKDISETQRLIIEQISQVFKEHTLIELHGEEEGKRIWANTVTEIVAMCGKGGGKDFSSRIGFAYAIYKLHCLKDPITYYDKSHGTYVDLLNIAVNAEQANNVFFSPLTNILNNSPYFREKGFEPRKSMLKFNSAPIRVHSGNSEAEAWEGLDLMLVVLDEIAAFKTDQAFQKASTGAAQRLSASSIYQMSKNSVVSRYPTLGKVILLSFPRYAGDFICQRYDEAGEEAEVLRIKAPTWVMNPFITREMLEPQFKRNFVEADQRFGCNPPEMIDAFFRDPQKVRQCFRGDWVVLNEGTIDEKYVLREREDLNPLNEDGTLKDWFRAEDPHMRYIHIDLGLKRDRAALCMAHSPGTRRIQLAEGLYDTLPVIKMDLIHYWEAGPGQEIDFAGIREFIKLLRTRFPIGQVTFDRWQSVDMIQILNKWGIAAERYSIKRNDYDNLASTFYDARFSGYYSKILVEDELLKLQTLPNGKVDHPEGFHDDLAQAVAGATAAATMFAEIDTDIDISVLGMDDDWEDLELLDALEDDIKQDGRRKERISVNYTEDDDDGFTIEAI